jgi:hypothetical protein
MFDMDASTQAKLYLTPSGWAAQLFEYWRGDFIFRFRFIATQYHRGRVRVVYDPSGSSAQNVSTVTATQVPCFNEVIDLTKDTNVEVRVPYAQALAWCKTFKPTTTSQIPWTTSSTATFNHIVGTTNGQIVMRVVTALTGPQTTTSVPILISVRAADNLEFAAPQDVFQRYSQFAPQSLTEYDATMSNTVVTGTSTSDDPYRFLVNHGEAVVTLRQLLRRSTFSWTWFDNVNPAQQESHTRYVFHRLPRAYGYDPNGVNTAKGLVTTATTYPFNMTSNHPITWVSMCFIATRGSVNWTANCVTNFAQPSSSPSFSIARWSILASYGITAQLQPTVASTSGIAYWALIAHRFGSAAGLALTNPMTCAMLTAACPMYSAYKFQTTDKLNITAASSQDDSQLNAFVLNARTFCGGQNGFEMYAAIGTDFNLHFFLNVPTLWVYTADPVPV